jgi:hypothetical protein
LEEVEPHGSIERFGREHLPIGQASRDILENFPEDGYRFDANPKRFATVATVGIEFFATVLNVVWNRRCAIRDDKASRRSEIEHQGNLDARNIHVYKGAAASRGLT